MPLGRLERLKTICTEQRECLGTQDTRPETDINPSGLLRAVRRKELTVHRGLTNNLALAVRDERVFMLCVALKRGNPRDFSRLARRGTIRARDCDSKREKSARGQKPRDCGSQQWWYF